MCLLAYIWFCRKGMCDSGNSPLFLCLPKLLKARWLCARFLSAYKCLKLDDNAVCASSSMLTKSCDRADVCRGIEKTAAA